jgi:hypothetical protein
MPAVERRYHQPVDDLDMGARISGTTRHGLHARRSAEDLVGQDDAVTVVGPTTAAAVAGGFDAERA